MSVILSVFGDVFGLMSIVLTYCKGFPQSHQSYLAARMSVIRVVGVAMILVTVRSFEVAMLVRTMSFEVVRCRQ